MIDLSAYEAVSGRLEEAECEAAVKRLVIGSCGPGDALDRQAVLAWVRAYQTQRTLMQLLLLDLADVRVQAGEVQFQLSRDLPPQLRRQLGASAHAPGERERGQD